MPAALIALVIGLLAGTIAAEDAKLDAMLQKAKEKVASEHAKVGKWADKNKLWRYGYLEWSDCVEFDPDDKTARARLGFEKTSTGSWVRSRDIEVKKIDEIDEDYRVEWEEQYDAKRGAAKKKALKEFEKVLEAAIKAGYEPAKLEAAKLIRRYDPFHAGAIAALGLELDKDGRPVEPEIPKDDDGNVKDDPAAGSEGDGGTPAAVGRGAIRNVDLQAIVTADRPHSWAAESGLPIEGSESRHHCILSTEMTADERKAVAEVAEQVRARFYKRYLVPNDVEFYTRKMVLLYLADREEHKKFVNSVYARDATNESDLDFTLNHAGGGTMSKHFAAWDSGGSEATEKDFACHYATHLLTSAINGGLPTWMNEAVAYEQSIGVLGTSWTSCINDVTTGDRAKKWGDPVNWRELIRDLVRLEEDTPFSTIIGLKANDIDPKIAAKCWSFLTWLLDTEGDKVWNLLGTLWGDEGQQNAAFKGVFGKDLNELETEWRRYVKANY